MFDLDGGSRTDLSLLDNILGDVIDFDRSSARLSDNALQTYAP